MIGTRLGVYELTEEVGAGGMATVYRAYQASMDRHVAVKLIRGNVLHDPTLKDRFQREGYLSTLTQRRSFEGLARLVDYRLDPGQAATTLVVRDSTVPGSSIARRTA